MVSARLIYQLLHVPSQDITDFVCSVLTRRVISGFCRGVDDIGALLVCYAE